MRNNYKDSLNGIKREMTRVSFETKVEIFVDGKKLPVTESKNISLKGIYVKAKGLDEGTECKIIIFLKGLERELKVMLNGKAVRVDDSGAAIIFTLVDIHSFMHLQNIVALSAGDHDKIGKEFVHRKNLPKVEKF